MGALQAARRQVDRSAPRARFASLRARPELPRLQPDRPRHRGAEPGGARRHRRARDPPDPRQRLPRARPGRARHPGAPGAAAAAEADARSSTPTSCCASDSTSSAAASSIARSRRSTKCCGSIRRTSTRCSTCRSCTRSSISGTTRTASGKQLVALSGPDTQPRNQAILAFLENELGLRRSRAATRRRRAHFESAIDQDPHDAGVSEPRRRAAQAGRSAQAPSAWDGCSTRRPSAPTSPSIGSSALTTQLGTPQRSKSAAGADRRQPAGLARAAGAGRHLRTRGESAAALDSCSRRSSTIRTASPCTRRSGTCC